MTEPVETKTRMPLWPLGIIGVLAGVLVIALVAVPSSPAPSGTTARNVAATGFDLTGRLELDATGAFKATDRSCVGEDGYDDMRTGAPVVVYDAAGTVIATGSLRGGALNTTGTQCVFPFTVADVPSGEAFYQVQVSHRGKVVVESAEAETSGAVLTLG